MTPKKQNYVKFSDKLTESLDDITGMISEHKSMIDAIQDIALELTSTIGTLNTLTVKYAGKANEILDILLPIIKKVPLIPDKVENLLVQMEEWTQKIIDNDESTTKTIADVQLGLRTGNVSKLQYDTGDLQKVTRALTRMLPKNP